MKINFESSSKGNPGPPGFDCVVRDCHGPVVQVSAGPLGLCDSIKAEVMGLFMGLPRLKSWGLLKC